KSSSARGAPFGAHHLRQAGICHGRWPDQLRREHGRSVSSIRALCRPYSKGRKAGRPAVPAADGVRAGDQSQDCESAWPQCPADPASYGRRGDRMIGRREFITLLGGGAAAGPIPARGQQPAKLPTIGFLGESTPPAQSERTAAFVQRLRELGWIEGRTVVVEYRWAEGRSERFAEIATEFVRLKVDAIATSSTPAVIAAKQVTSVIPIVAVMGDPVGTGLVASLARPGGNVTGLSVVAPDLAGK